MRLTAEETAILSGEEGPARAFAMDILVNFSKALGASSLIDVTQAHVDGCLYHGDVSLDFVERLVADAGRVKVPTTLNVGSMDLIHPELIGGTKDFRASGRRLMEAHLALGCQSSFTCAPYQTASRPKFGEQIAWGESNAIVFANSVIGARTNRYGDFIDLVCGMVGRAPAFGLHLDENRRGEIVFEVEDAPDDPALADAVYVAVGYLVGSKCGGRVPVIAGLPPPPSEDALKALGAVAASSGEVALFHAVGITPEAPTLRDATGGRTDLPVVRLTRADLSAALDGLSTAARGTTVTAVCLGTPHFSRSEFEALDRLLPGFRAAPGVDIYINTGRETLSEIRQSGLLQRVEAAGIVILADTCTYVTALVKDLSGVVMTNSGKWAHYAPGNIGVGVAFGTLADCMASAASGKVIRSGL